MFFNRRKTEFKINYLPFLGVVLLLNFPRAVNAQTNSCPWAGDDQTICIGDCVTIGCEDLNEESGYCFYWTSLYLDIENIYSPIIEVCPVEDDIFTMYVTDSNGMLVDEYMFIVNTITNDVIINSEPTVICSSEGVTLYLVNEYFSYLWSNGETTASINVNEPGLYSLTVTHENSKCVSTAQIEVASSLDTYAIEELLVSEGFFMLLYDNVMIDGMIEGLTENNIASNSLSLNTDLIVDCAELLLTINNNTGINLETNSENHVGHIAFWKGFYIGIFFQYNSNNESNILLS